MNDNRSYNYSYQPIKRIAPVNTVIIILNVLAFIYLEWLAPSGTYLKYVSSWYMIRYEHEYYRLFTCTFLHFGIQHLIGNMVVLGVIGDNLERAMGKLKYLILYVVSAVGSSLVSYLVAMYLERLSISAGASGAIFGVVGGLLYVLIANHGRLEDLTSTRLALFAALTLYQGVRNTGVDNVAHFSGLFFGVLMALILYRKKNMNRYGGF